MDGEKLETAKASLHALIDQLSDRDALGIVTYGSTAKVVLDLTKGDDSGRQRMHQAVNDIDGGGATAIEAGLEEAIAVLQGSDGQAHKRVFLITDMQPNVGATDTGSFLAITRDAADNGIGLTVWGVGLGLGAELTEAMANVRGGNAWFFSDMQTMTERVTEEFDTIVTPLAYDLEVQMSPASDMRIDRSYGAPMDDDATQVDFGASTLFLSRRDGGIGVTLRMEDGGAIDPNGAGMDVAEMVVSWAPIDGGDRVVQSLDARFEGGFAWEDDFAQADDLGVYKMASLVDELAALDAGAAWCEGALAKSDAMAQVEAASARLQSRSEQIDAPQFAQEAALMDQLRQNIDGGPDNCMD
jgi:Ca-activated chloride channel family protein